ncbi:MAG: hypothetical protein MUO50_12545 [Longimicrobiales bacterium]|nr:hypothetical protein [Longimicrobiales bacterium]
MTHHFSDHAGRWALRRPLVAAVSSALLLAGPFSGAAGQVALTLPELDGLYRSAVSEYDAAFQRLEVLSSQQDRADRDFAAALSAGNEAETNRAYGEILRIGPQRRQAARRVEDKAQELIMARERLLDANAQYLTELLIQAAAASDPMEQRVLATSVADTRNRITELRNLEDPQVTLEPVPDINAEPRDGPAELRNKATILDLTAGQYEEQHAYYQRQLEGLRRDQSLLRRSGDFLADFARFDDPTVPVGPPGNRTVPTAGQVPPPPGADSLGVEGGFLTLEQRISALVVLQEELNQRIETIRVRANDLRRLAGGEWA